jgi:hypothetical protein
MMASAHREETDVTSPTDQPGPGRDPDPDPGHAPAKRGGALKAVSDALIDPQIAQVNPFGSAAIVVGLIGLFFGALGVLPGIGVLVALLGLARSRRLARGGAAKTGAWQSLAGLVVSVVGLLLQLPPIAAVLPWN